MNIIDDGRGQPNPTPELRWQFAADSNGECGRALTIRADVFGLVQHNMGWIQAKHGVLIHVPHRSDAAAGRKIRLWAAPGSVDGAVAELTKLIQSKCRTSPPVVFAAPAPRCPGDPTVWRRAALFQIAEQKCTGVCVLVAYVPPGLEQPSRDQVRAGSIFEYAPENVHGIGYESFPRVLLPVYYKSSMPAPIYGSREGTWRKWSETILEAANRELREELLIDDRSCNPITAADFVCVAAVGNGAHIFCAHFVHTVGDLAAYQKLLGGLDQVDLETNGKVNLPLVTEKGFERTDPRGGRVKRRVGPERLPRYIYEASIRGKFGECTFVLMKMLVDGGVITPAERGQVFAEAIECDELDGYYAPISRAQRVRLARGELPPDFRAKELESMLLELQRNDFNGFITYTKSLFKNDPTAAESGLLIG